MTSRSVVGRAEPGRAGHYHGTATSDRSMPPRRLHPHPAAPPLGCWLAGPLTPLSLLFPFAVDATLPQEHEGSGGAGCGGAAPAALAPHAGSGSRPAQFAGNMDCVLSASPVPAVPVPSARGVSAPGGASAGARGGAGGAEDRVGSGDGGAAYTAGAGLLGRGPRPGPRKHQRKHQYQDPPRESPW